TRSARSAGLRPHVLCLPLRGGFIIYLQPGMLLRVPELRPACRCTPQENAMSHFSFAFGLLLMFPLTGMAKLVGRMVPYEQGGTKFEGYLAYDVAQEGKRPGVLVVH